MLQVRETESRGRGVFTNRFIFRDGLIESSPVLVIPEDEIETLMETEFSSYLYHEFDGKKAALAFGVGSLINHSYDPNTIFIYNSAKKTIDYYAYKDIYEGQEVLINYNGDPEDKTPVWFEVS